MLTQVRHWFHTYRKPRHKHVEFQKRASFSGEGMEQRTELHALLDRWIDETVSLADADQLNVWRIGQLTFRVRMGHAADAEMACSVEDDGVELRYPDVIDEKPGECRPCVTKCPRCEWLVTEDGESL